MKADDVRAFVMEMKRKGDEAIELAIKTRMSMGMFSKQDVLFAKSQLGIDSIPKQTVI